MTKSLKNKTSDVLVKIMASGVELISYRLQKKLFYRLHRRLRDREAEHLLRQGNFSILTGRFRGLRLPDRLSHRNFSLPQLLGIYELPVQSRLVELMNGFEQFVDIGCGCGFFTNGLAKVADVACLGFDLEQEQVMIADRVADANGIGGKVRHKVVDVNQDYNDILRCRKSLCLVDIEGGELAFIERLDLEVIRSTGFLIECHKTRDQTNVQVAQEIERKLAATHQVEILSELDIFSLSARDQSAIEDVMSRNDLIILSHEQRKQVSRHIVAVPVHG